MEKERLFELFKMIAKEASNGKVDSFFIYHMLFETMIEESMVYTKSDSYKDVLAPVLKIDNVDSFKKALAKYVIDATNFYKDDSYFNYFEDDETRLKSIISTLWINATYEDFLNPIQYIEKKREFFKNSLNESNISVPSLDSRLIISNSKNHLTLETPYKVSLKITNGIDEFVLPDIYYGIANNVAYIYGIQSHAKNENAYAKKMNRLLYHVNEGFNEEIVNDENLKDITPSFVLAANILLGQLKESGINTVVVNSVLPIRYISKQLLGKEADLPIEKKGQYEDEQINNLQKNMTDKFIRTFRRVAYHHTGLEITSYPMELDSSMHMTILENDICNNPLLEETFMPSINRNR